MIAYLDESSIEYDDVLECYVAFYTDQDGGEVCHAYEDDPNDFPLFIHRGHE